MEMDRLLWNFGKQGEFNHIVGNMAGKWKDFMLLQALTGLFNIKFE